MPTTSRRAAVLLAGVLLVLAAVYGRGLGHRATTLDDEAIVFRNPVQRHFGWRELRDAFDPRASRLAYGLQYTPLRDLSHALDSRLFADDPGPHHLQPILLHALATVALFLLVRRLGGAPLAAATAALVFAVHPLQVESVAWISGRTVPLAGALLLWALVAWRSARTAGRAGLWATAVLLVVLANLSKQSAVVAPALLLAVELAARGPAVLRRRDTLLAYAPVVALCAGFVVLGLWIARREGIVVPDGRDLAAQVRLSLSALGWYAGTLAWPAGLLPAHHLEPPPSWLDGGVLRGVAALLVAAGVVAVAGRRAPIAAAGVAIALVSLLPGLHGLGTQVVAERYAYVFVAGAGMAAGAAAEAFARRTPALTATAVVGTGLLLATASFARVAVWHDDLTLYEDALATEPDDPLWHHMRGRALADAGRAGDGAVAMQQARALHGDRPVDGYCALPPVLTEVALLREREGDLAAAEDALTAGLEAARAGEVDRAGVDLGAFYLRRGDRERARSAYLRAMARDPEGARLSRSRVIWLDDLARVQAAPAAAFRDVVARPQDVAARDAVGSAAPPAALPARGPGAHNAAMADERGSRGHAGSDGVLYRNQDDKRVIVPKRNGPGWTINFAHPWAIPALLGAFALAVGPGLLLLWSGMATPLRLAVVEAASIAALVLLAMRAAKG